MKSARQGIVPRGANNQTQHEIPGTNQELYDEFQISSLNLTGLFAALIRMANTAQAGELRMRQPQINLIITTIQGAKRSGVAFALTY